MSEPKDLSQRTPANRQPPEEQGSDASLYMETKDLLLPLVGALWACSTFVLPLALELNRIRDKVILGVDGGNTLTTAHRNLLINNDWSPLNDFLVCLCFGFGLVCLALPFLLAKPQRKSVPVWLIVFFVSAVSIGTAIKWHNGVERDLAAMQAAIAATSVASSTATTNNFPSAGAFVSNATVSNVAVLNASTFNAPANFAGPTNTTSVISASTNSASGSATITQPGPPFKAATIAVSHSALSGVMAGFALAGLFLLIESAKAKSDCPEMHSRAILMLFAAFLTGGISAYLYSAITGDTEHRAYYLFLFPSAIFALHVYALMAGINMAFAAFKLEPQVCEITRNISFGVVIFTALIVIQDLWEAARQFPPAATHFAWLLLAAGGATILVAFSFFCRHHIARLGILPPGFNMYCYLLLGFSLLAALFGGAYKLADATRVQLPLAVPILMYMSTVGLAVWTCHNILHDTKVATTPRRTEPTTTGINAEGLV